MWNKLYLPTKPNSLTLKYHKAIKLVEFVKGTSMLPWFYLLQTVTKSFNGEGNKIWAHNGLEWIQCKEMKRTWSIRIWDAFILTHLVFQLITTDIYIRLMLWPWPLAAGKRFAVWCFHLNTFSLLINNDKYLYIWCYDIDLSGREKIYYSKC